MRRVVAGLGSAVRALQLAPVETVKAVAVTLDGTAAMLGQAAGQLGAAAKSGLEGGAQRLGVTSRQAKASISATQCPAPGVRQPKHLPWHARHSRLV